MHWKRYSEHSSIVCVPHNLRSAPVLNASCLHKIEYIEFRYGTVIKRIYLSRFRFVCLSHLINQGGVQCRLTRTQPACEH